MALSEATARVAPCASCRCARPSAPAGPPPPPPVRRAVSPPVVAATRTQAALPKSPRPLIQNDDDRALCYICYKPTTETCQCQCKPTVHADCLLRSVRISKRPHCTICHGPIANLRVRQRRRYLRSLTVAAVPCGRLRRHRRACRPRCRWPRPLRSRTSKPFTACSFAASVRSWRRSGPRSCSRGCWNDGTHRDGARHFDYVTDGRGTAASALASVGRCLSALAPRRGA